MTSDGKDLHVQHETEMLTRRLIVARTALETISNGECAPETSKTARAALDSLDTLDGLDELKVFYRKMSAGEYEHFLAERKIAIARTALETITNGETDAGVHELARETLDGFSVLSDGEQFKGFFIGVQQDQPIPEVDPTDLKRFHENTIERSREAGPGVAIGLGTLGLGRGISGEDAGPLCVRNWVIGIAIMQGLLGDWQQGTELDGSVFRVAATIPVNGVQFDPGAFVTRLRAESGAQVRRITRVVAKTKKVTAVKLSLAALIIRRSQDLTVTPVLRLADGAETSLAPVTIKSQEVKSFDIGDAIAAASAPLLGTYGSVALRYLSPTSGTLYAAMMIRRSGHPVAFHVDATGELQDV